MQQVLIADGYNLIFSEYSIFKDNKKRYRKINLSDARETLLKILSNYASYKGIYLIVVFDAYKVVNGAEKVYNFDRNTNVIYTSESETADTVIERTVHQMKQEYEIKVATSDKSQQDYIFSQGATRISSREMWIEIMNTDKKLYDEHIKKRKANEPLVKLMNTRTVKILESIRKGLKDNE